MAFFVEYDNPKRVAAFEIIKKQIEDEKFEGQIVCQERNGEVHYWLDSRWDWADFTQPPFVRVVKKEDEKVYLIYRNGKEVLVN